LANPAPFSIVRHAAFSLSLKKLTKKHPAIETDVAWLEGRLKMNPALLGTPIPNLKLALPVYKTRLKDSCCKIGASGGWRLIYAIHAEKREVTLILIYHKREFENPSNEYLQQTLGAALAEGIQAEAQNSGGNQLSGNSG
jgi:mRNA-degrading endonuclease RelE of RelBE toxin-antitoxin system